MAMLGVHTRAAPTCTPDGARCEHSIACGSDPGAHRAPAPAPPVAGQGFYRVDAHLEPVPARERCSHHRGQRANRIDRDRHAIASYGPTGSYARDQLRAARVQPQAYQWRFLSAIDPVPLAGLGSRPGKRRVRQTACDRSPSIGRVEPGHRPPSAERRRQRPGSQSELAKLDDIGAFSWHIPVYAESIRTYVFFY